MLPSCVQILQASTLMQNADCKAVQRAGDVGEKHFMPIQDCSNGNPEERCRAEAIAGKMSWENQDAVLVHLLCKVQPVYNWVGQHALDDRDKYP